MPKEYDIIYLDPPWRFTVWSRDTGLGRSADSHYQTMTLEEIKSMHLPMAVNCAVFMWATLPMLPEAFEVITAWGQHERDSGREPIRYKTVAFAWVKLRKRWLPELLAIAKESTRIEYQNPLIPSFIPNRLQKLLHFGMGYWTRANVELCLLAVRGKNPRISRAIPQVILAPVGEHSQKPPVVRERIVGLLGDRPRVEMFAREEAAGWDRWGLEAPAGKGNVNDGHL